MKNFSFTRLLAIICLANSMFFSPCILNAQRDILDLYGGNVDDCTPNSEISISVNIDGCNADTTVIVRNISGYRLTTTQGTDKKYKFLAENTNFCSSASSTGEFRILFKLGGSLGTDIKIRKLSFLVFDNSGASITGVNYYVNSSSYPASSAGESTGIRYTCEDVTTGFDYVSVIYSDDGSASEESQLFVMDKVYLPSQCQAVPAPTIGPITQPNCTVATGSVTLNGLPSGTWTILPVNYSSSGSSATISGLGQGTYKFRVKNSDCCISPESADVIINAQPAIPDAPTGNADQSFCGSATVASMAATGTSIKWYSASTGGTPLASGTSLVNGTTYYASQTVGICESNSRLAVAVTINAIPAAPTGNADQSFCGSATVASLTATGTSVKWYSASTGGTPLASGTSLINGTTYYASQTVGICESTSRLAVAVTVNPLPDVSIGDYGPYCTGASPITITGNPTDTNGDWSGPGITDNNNGTATFNPSVAGVGAHTVTYGYTDGICPNSASSTIQVKGDCPEIICLIDLSGSMTTSYSGSSPSNPNEQRIAYAKRAATAFTDLLNENFGNGIYFGLAGFKNAFTPYNPAECRGYIYYPANIVNSGTVGSINSTITTLSTGYRTPLLAGLETARSMFTQSGMKAIVVLSDGAHNCPDWINDYLTGPYNDLMNQITGISIHTIGFGSGGEVDLDLLENMAGRKGGIYCDLTNGSNVNMKPAYILDPALTPADAWDAGQALDLAYSNILLTLGLNYAADPIGIISKGSIEQFDIPVSAFDSKVCLFISWVTPQSQLLKVRIRTSDNAELPSSHPDISFVNRENYTIVTVTGSYLTKQGVIGTNPWKLELSAADISSESEKFQYFVMNKSKELSFNTWLDKERYLTGDRIKIYMELLAGGQRLSPLDKTSIAGTMPVKGLGNILAGTKTNQKQLNELERSNNDKFADDLPFSSLKTRLIEIANPGILSQRIKIKGLLFNDEGLSGDEKASDGIYTAQTQKLRKEGLYLFNVSVSDTGRGKNISRENQLNAFVRVKIKPGGFIRDITQIDTILKGEKLYKIRLKLRDEFGNKPSPGSLRNINLSIDKGKLTGNLIADPDGSFTQIVSIPENIKPSDVKVTMKAYDREGTQRLKSHLPWWIYIGGICIISILTVTGVSIRRKRTSKSGK